jgi:NAD-dependent DNA ligase
MSKSSVSKKSRKIISDNELFSDEEPKKKTSKKSKDVSDDEVPKKKTSKKSKDVSDDEVPKKKTSKKSKDVSDDEVPKKKPSKKSKDVSDDEVPKKKQSKDMSDDEVPKKKTSKKSDDEVPKKKSSKILDKDLDKLIDSINENPDDLESLGLVPEVLVLILKKASNAYYNKDNAIMDDRVFDDLKDYLAEIDPENPFCEEIGAEVQSGSKIQLPYHMGSMDKVKPGSSKLGRWLKDYKGPYYISDKLDGISCLFIKKGGRCQLFTRGNGRFGQDISHLEQLVNIACSDNFDFDELPDGLAVRGELIMSREAYKKYAASEKNARALVAGMVNSKAESFAEKGSKNKKKAHDVDLIMYEVISPAMLPDKQFAFLKDNHFKVVSYDVYKTINEEVLVDVLEERKKETLYEIDGIIITDQKKYLRNTSGNPKYSFAYKGRAGDKINVTVVDVLWRISKDGKFKPRVQFTPTALSGVMITYATAFNGKYVEENGIGKGAILEITRSGDVIPYIVRVIKSVKPQFPKGNNYHWDNNHVDLVLDSDEIDSNYEVVVRRMSRFVRTLDVENLSEGLVTKLVEAGYDTFQKIIQLKKKDLLEIDGFQNTLAEKIYNNLQKALSEVTILKLMVASNLFGQGFGERKLVVIMDAYPNIVNEYTKKTYQIWYDQLVKLPGFNDKTVSVFLDKLPDFQEFYSEVKILPELKAMKKEHKEKKVKANGIFEGEHVVFTGFRNINWKAFVEAEGGKVSDSISGNSTLLVYIKGKTDSSKYKTAVSKGIPTMTQEEFAKKYDLEFN